MSCRSYVYFSAFQTSIAFAVIWFLQGLVQGGSWPACAKIMKQVQFSRQCIQFSVFAQSVHCITSFLGVLLNRCILVH